MARNGTTVYMVALSSGSLVFLPTLAQARAELRLDPRPDLAYAECCKVRSDLSPRQLACALLTGSGWQEGDGVDIR